MTSGREGARAMRGIAALAAWTTGFRSQNPKAYAALFAALHDADRFIADHPERAATCLKAEQSKVPTALIKTYLADPEMAYGTALANSGALSEFLARTDAQAARGRLAQAVLSRDRW